MDGRPNRFDDWLAGEFAATGPFTLLIVLLAIDAETARPLRSSHAHVIGAEMVWTEMAALLDRSGRDWDAVLFTPLAAPGGGPVSEAEARRALADHVQAIMADRLLLNRGHFFDRDGRRLHIVEMAPQ